MEDFQYQEWHLDFQKRMKAHDQYWQNTTTGPTASFTAAIGVGGGAIVITTSDRGSIFK